MSKSESSSHELASGVNSNRSGILPGLEQLKTGSQVIVGNHRVEIVSYLAEGGFAQIYVVKFVEYANELEKQPSVTLALDQLACLKRVLVTDENGLNEMRNEVSVMKQLSGSPNVVQYYDSHASRSRDGTAGFEVMLLMELCPNNSLLDYMNQRLATKLTEHEIIKIMFDVTRALAQMHYLLVPLIHRDIKIENVLVDAENNFKLCDFGSTSICLPVASTHQEIALLTNNIYIHTTPQYRSPEMIDLYRCLPIDEKSDIWALGIFLYKLLFYTTPFELTGQFAILHSKYEFPANHYSSKLINLIIIMLAENPNLRPNIYQVMDLLCSILKCQNPIEDKYKLGPYSFDKYAKYQAKLQKIQYQMYLSYENKERVDAMNDLFINCFEVAPKQPANMGTNTTKSSDLSLTSKEDTSEMGGDQNETLSVGEEDIGLVQRQFPSVEDLDTYLHDGGKREGGRHDSNTSTSLGTGSHSSSKIDLAKSPDDLSILKQVQNPIPQSGSSQMVRDATARSTTSAKQHKSSNPFPFIQQDNYGVDSDSNRIFDSDGVPKDPDQQFFAPDSGLNPSQNVQSHQQISNYQLNEQQGAAQSFQPPRQDAELPGPYNHYFGGSASPMLERSTENHATSHYPYQASNNKQEQQAKSLIQQQTQQQAQPQKQAKPLGQQQPQSLAQQQPQSHSQKSTVEKEELLVDFSRADKKEPQKLDLTIDSVDLSTPSKGGAKNSINVSEQSLVSSESFPVEVRKKSSKQNTSRAPPTEKPAPHATQPATGRQSLDLKYQEMDFSVSPPPDVKLEKIKTTSHQTRKSNNGSSDLKKSFARGRKSLDLDQLKRETATPVENISNKRKSFFGKFKS
ncbi:LANO_0A03070g1_1 [Lachancea nothofagi CBS 11611]|uniref:LANO_0A03070g1_1 n=1 Tax=Lachancea nothofagi CBS 11611 TaxID=1266666 RepID=A0A1G4IP21_9SACH|nr:LANO_0A03070g1_1 [Lachancea nothofagi CBS 11611]